MKKFRKPLLFALALVPVAVVSAYFTILYQIESFDPATLAATITQMGSKEALIALYILQIVVYTLFCSFTGHILADKIGLIKPIRFKKVAVIRTLVLSTVAGILLSLDYWTFGTWIPEIREATAAGLHLNTVLASVLYGGIIEEIMLRLFMMSLIAWLIWKAFFRKNETVPTGAIIAANVIAALLFAVGHLPATILLFGELTPMILLRCFLLNGGFGLIFGWLYYQHGIQYSMLSHALVHIISKTIWGIFI